MTTLLLRVLAGTCVYAVVVVLAAPFPSAAGLMLVFPTLNGLAYVFSERDRVLAMAPSMLWMPVVNGVLCAAYLLAFLALAPRVPAAPLAWSLTAVAIVLFVVTVRQRFVRAGIPARQHFTYAVGATLAGIILVACAAAMAGEPAHLAAGGEAVRDIGSWRFAADALSRSAAKIAIFALCLAAFLTATRTVPLSDGTRGILAGLPFAPFGGLVSVAADASIDLATRLDIIRHMAVSIWLGPAIAIWFIYLFPHALVRWRPRGIATGLVLVTAWTLCAAAIAVIAATLH
jgi:hypothetical protein